MVIGVTHGKNKDSVVKDLSAPSSSRNDMIIMKFIEGPKKN
jgi:hypothetical protein